MQAATTVPGAPSLSRMLSFLAPVLEKNLAPYSYLCLAKYTKCTLSPPKERWHAWLVQAQRTFAEGMDFSGDNGNLQPCGWKVNRHLELGVCVSPARAANVLEAR